MENLRQKTALKIHHTSNISLIGVTNGVPGRKAAKVANRGISSLLLSRGPVGGQAPARTSLARGATRNAERQLKLATAQAVGAKAAAILDTEVEFAPRHRGKERQRI
jgi:hypothetical protein